MSIADALLSVDINAVNSRWFTSLNNSILGTSVIVGGRTKVLRSED